MVRWESDELRKNRQYMLFDGNRNVMILVDDGRKMIMEFDEATLQRQRQRMQAQMQPMMKQLREQMKHMTPEQRRMMEQQMGGLLKGSQGGAGPTFSTKEVGRDRINGIPCRRVDVRRNGQPTYELCVASRSDARIPKQDYDTLMRMFAFMRNIAKMGTAAPPIPENINGVPVRMKNHANGEVQTVKKISTSTLPGRPVQIAVLSEAGFWRSDAPVVFCGGSTE